MHELPPLPTDPEDPAALAAFVEDLPSPGDVAARSRALGVAVGAAQDVALPTAADVDTAIGCVDLTTLKATDTPARVVALCERARRPDPEDPSCPSVAAVCVHADLVAPAVRALEGSGLPVASVAGAFPHGRSPRAVKVAEVAAAVAAGAGEVDVVIDRGALAEQRWADVVADLRALVAAAGEAKVKVILEHAELADLGALSTAAHLALLAGADVVKTSTGTVEPGATREAVLVLCEAVAAHERATGRRAGVKPSGGIRETGQALAYLAVVRAVLGDDAAGRLRLGASSLLDDLVATRRAAR